MLFVIPFLIVSCKKNDSLSKHHRQESVAVSEQKIQGSKVDSSAIRKKDSIVDNAPKTKKVLREGDMKNEKDDQIIVITDAQQLPFKLKEEFTKDNQRLVLKIKNYSKPVIKASIDTKEKDFNIRFNQIKLPNGDYDGPFSRNIFYEIKEKGEVWLIIGKNLMASGKSKGNFTVNVE